MHRMTDYQLDETSAVFHYLDRSSALANNLYNTALYHMRQFMTGLKKDKPTENERAVIEAVRDALPEMNRIRMEANDRKAEKYKQAVEENNRLPEAERREIKSPQYSRLFVMPTASKWMLSYEFLECFLKVTENPDYHAMTSAQSAQNVIRRACRDMKAYVKSCKEFKKNPAKYTGAPKLPHYKKKGGRCAFFFGNQDCRIKDGRLMFPNTDFCVKVAERPGKLAQVEVRPFYGQYKVITVYDTGHAPALPEASRRIMAVDIGVDNTAAITNNAGLPCYLLKGGVLKSVNQRYNKKMAAIKSAQTKGTTNKFVPTPESIRLGLDRENTVRDCMRKYGRLIIDIAVHGGIDTIIYGKNTGWKQRSNLGHKENQNFVQLPFTILEQCLRSLCEEKGIRFLTREESYTSKASFLDNDAIPTFDPDNPNVKYPFSGRRRPTRYKGNYKKDGFRGLYTSADGTVINSDLNGSANIGRKAFPDMFTMEGAVMPDFDNVILVKAPDYEYNRLNRAKQLSENKGISKSRQRRLDRKQRRKCA